MKKYAVVSDIFSSYMNTEHVSIFKNHFDIFLANIPYQPTATGLGRARVKTSLMEQLPLFYAQTR